MIFVTLPIYCLSFQSPSAFLFVCVHVRNFRERQRDTANCVCVDRSNNHICEGLSGRMQLAFWAQCHQSQPPDVGCLKAQAVCPSLYCSLAAAMRHQWRRASRGTRSSSHHSFHPAGVIQKLWQLKPVPAPPAPGALDFIDFIDIRAGRDLGRSLSNSTHRTKVHSLKSNLASYADYFSRFHCLIFTHREPSGSSWRYHW
uniref:Uncharacterized protein n=1 Tax=Crocodylus porosus TaxID=8502 RepID=A0A7M4F5C2_CROPO